MAGKIHRHPASATPSGQGSIANGENGRERARSRAFHAGNRFRHLSVHALRQRGAPRQFCRRAFRSMSFSVYPVSASEFFLVETDAITASTPLLTVGTLMQQVGFPFSGPAAGFVTSSVGGLAGQFLSAGSYVPDMAVVSLSATGSSGFSLNVVENQAGTIKNFTGASNFVDADTFGRVSTNLLTPIDPVFYMINQNQAFVVGEIFNNPFFRGFVPSNPLAHLRLPRSRAVLWKALHFRPQPPFVIFSGVLSLDGVQAVTGTQDQSNLGVQTQRRKACRALIPFRMPAPASEASCSPLPRISAALSTSSHPRSLCWFRRRPAMRILS